MKIKILFIIFLPVLIFSSSPKLNFFHKKTPLPTATAAAGVDICKIHFSMFSKAELILLTICGLPQARDVTDREFNNIKIKK